MFEFFKLDFPTTKPRGYWTRDGKKIPGSDFEGPEGANDLRIYRLAIQFTKDGKPEGPPILPPEGANDLEIDVRPPKPKGGKPEPKGGEQIKGKGRG